MNSKYQSAGELIDFSIGGGWGKEEPAADYSNKVAIVRGADFPDVDNGIFDRIPVRWEKETKATKASLKAGDVILEISGGTDERPTGRTVRVSQELLDSFDCPVIPASFCRLVRPNEYVNSQYFYYWLQDMYAKGRTWNYQNRSTGLSNFQFKVFCEAEEVRVPSYNEQCAIAEVLCLIDKKRMANIKLNDYLAQMADTMFVDAFGGLGDNAVLSDIAEITMGQSPAGTSYNEDGNGTVFYQGRGEFGWRYPTQRLFTTEPKRMAKSGDVLMSVRAPVGDLNVAYEDCCIGRGLAAINCDYPSYCLYLMRSLGRKLDSYNGEGTVFGSINGKALKGLEIALPEIDNIISFEGKVAPIDAQIRCNEAENRSLTQLRDTLLPKLMSGEIDVSKIDLTQLNNHLA